MFILRLSSLFYSAVAVSSCLYLSLMQSRCERGMIKKQDRCSKPLIIGKISTKDQDEDRWRAFNLYVQKKPYPVMGTA